MKISITYIDGTVESFSNVDETEYDDNFLGLNDEDGNTKADITLTQIRKVEYD